MEKLANIAESHKEEVRVKLETKQVDPGMFDGVQRDLFGILRIQFFRDYAKTPEYLLWLLLSILPPPHPSLLHLSFIYLHSSMRVVLDILFRPFHYSGISPSFSSPLFLWFYFYNFILLYCYFIIILLFYCYFIVILYEFSLRFLRYLVFKAEVAEMREAAMAAAGMTNQQEINNTNNNNTNNNSNHLTTYTNQHKHEEKEKEKEKEREWTLDPLAPALAAFAKIREKTKKVVRDPADKPRKMCSKLLRDRYASSLLLLASSIPSNPPLLLSNHSYPSLPSSSRMCWPI